MAKKNFWLGMLILAFVICGTLTSCWSTGTARETLPQTAVTIQRVRATGSLLDELLGTTNASLDMPMQIFIDNNEPFELANGVSTTILVNNGEHMVYAVLGNAESKSIRFTARSQTITVNVFLKKSLLGRINLEIEVK